MLEELLASGFKELGIEADGDALRRYRIYYEYLGEINRVMNLTAISGEKDVAELHFLDSAALLTVAELGGKRVIDLGAGAGFPGLALKIARPDIRLTLLDSLDKRVGFLRDCCERLGFDDVRCVHARAEEIPAGFRESFDAATSRAVARLDLLCELCLPYVKKGGVFIAMKGPDPEEELREAGRAIGELGGEYLRTVSYSVPGTDAVHSAILIKKKTATPSRYPRRWAQIKKSPL